jgi:predicted peroxiredoxin
MFIDLQAVVIAERELKTFDEKQKAKLSKLMDEFEKNGGHLMVCPHCLAEQKIPQANLRKGIKLATKELLDDLIQNAGTVVESTKSAGQAE